jgi:hypothetical protein
MTSTINAYYFVSSTVGFNATGAFVATWNHIPYSSNQSLEVNAQIALVTDGYFSFFIMNFGRLDQYTFSSFGNLTGYGYSAFSGTSSTSNVGLPGTFIYLVNGQSNYF